MVSIGTLNALPADVRDQLYLRLIPGELLDRFGVDPASLRGPPETARSGSPPLRTRRGPASSCVTASRIAIRC